jgi:hypothetical protein
MLRQRGSGRRNEFTFAERVIYMMRKLALAVAFGFAVPAAALACDHEKTEQAKTTTDEQQVLLAQADTTKSPSKKSTTTKKKGAPKKPKDTTPK